MDCWGSTRESLPTKCRMVLTLGKDIAAVHKGEDKDLPSCNNLPQCLEPESTLLWTLSAKLLDAVIGQIDILLLEDPIWLDDSREIRDEEKGANGNRNRDAGVNGEDPPPARHTLFTV